MAGNIQRRPNGAWRARLRDDAGKEYARHFKRKVDAQRWLDEQTASSVRGHFVDPSAGKVSLAAYYSEWAPRQVWVEGTRRAMDLAVRSADFSDLALNRLRRSHIESWVVSMGSPSGSRSRGLAPSTVRTRFNNVRAVLRAAVSDRVIAEDPSVGVRLPRTRKTGGMQIPDPGTVGHLLNVADEPFKAFVALCAFAGLRLGEAAGLQRGDIDFVRRTVEVKRQVQRGDGQSVLVRAPKYGSERTIPVADELLLTLGHHIEAVLPPNSEADMWLFRGNKVGTPPHQNTVGHRWRATLRAAGASGIRMHDLRHFYASGLIRQGCDVVTVQRALGHASPSTTLNTYSHLWPDAADRTRSAAAAMHREATAGFDSQQCG